MLDEYQKKAAWSGTGSCLVIAGPGSGKTKCIVERITHLIRTGIKPQSILVITFTREAAGEMQLRYIADAGKGGVRFCTFHSLFYHILAERYGADAIAPKSEKEKDGFYDSLAPRTKQLFLQEPETLKAWRDRFSHILVDEFQDINEEQFELVRMLLDESQNLFAVGDDDQAIYAFRGASPEIMLCFKTYFPDAREVVLLNNYRSKRQIVECAGRLISHNKSRYEKAISSFSDAYGRVSYLNFNDEMAESAYVTDEIKRILSTEKSDTVGVLFRTHYQSAMLRERLSMEQIPFYAKEKLGSIREHFIYRDISAMLVLAYDEKCRDDARLRAEQVFGSDCERHADIIKRLSPYAAANYLCRGGGYDLYLKREAHGNKLYEDELMTKRECVLQYFCGMKSARDFLERIDIKTDSGDHPESRVGLYTFHGAKGLEFDHVYIIGATERECDDIEEERRMFYVAVTRAKSELCISTVKRRNGRKVYPSMFIGEMQLKNS